MAGGSSVGGEGKEGEGNVGTMSPSVSLSTTISSTTGAGPYVGQVRALQEMGFAVSVSDMAHILDQVGGDVEMAANILAGD